MSSRLPWPLKIGAKIVLSRLPIPYAVWSRINLFKHGEMLDLAYARGVFERHFGLSGLQGGDKAFTCLELGPGDSLMSALLARAAGAAKTFIIDTGAYASRDISVYRNAAREIFKDVAARPAYEEWTAVEDMLRDCNASYLVEGLASLRSVPTGSVDWSWSQAVLEHVKRSDFDETMKELRRVARTGGRSSHRIDLQDHLGGRLNSLRFSEKTWEGHLFSRSGFYTNRLRRSEIVASAERAGFSVLGMIPEMWPTLPTPRTAMSSTFRDLSDDDLRTKWIDLLLVAR
jgi:hypothetical protein